MRISAISVLVVFVVLYHGNLALNAETYTTFIEQLARDSKFLDEYTKWSFELFSRRDYLYGNDHGKFRCPIDSLGNNDSIPTSVHTLRASDVTCVAAMGDSFMTGLGAHAITPLDLLLENRGISWSVGGDYTYSKFLSLPNILREYNSHLAGFSARVSMMASDGKNSTDNTLNLGRFGARSAQMSHQAKLLIDRIRNERVCDWTADWKILTLFVGSNDLCSFCEDSNGTKHTPEQYVSNIRQALDKLYHARMPRTFVNLVLPPDVRNMKDRSNDGYICEVLQKRLCACASSPTVEQAKILDDFVPQYHQALLDLITTGRYDGRDDFTVVVQPFMANTTLSYRSNRSIASSYFAPDCFHFSGKGHSLAAFSLWNNMLEPVGGKRWSWHIDESFKCPTEEYPYLFTSKNSAKALSSLQRTTTQMSSIIGSTSAPNTTPEALKKNEKPTSKTSSKTTKFIAVVIILISIAAIVLWIVKKRRKTRVFEPQSGRQHFDDVHNQQLTDEDEDVDVEVWTRPNTEPVYFDDNKTTKTHGARISFD